MEDMLSKIIEMDQKASSLTEDAQKEKAQLEKDIIKTKETIYNDYIERARKRIDINEKTDIENANKKTAEIKANQSEIIKKLEDSYSKNGDIWVNEIVKRVLTN